MSAEVAWPDPAKEDAELYKMYNERRLARAELECCHAKPSAGHGDNVQRLCRQIEEIEGQIVHHVPMSYRGLTYVMTMAADILAARAIMPNGYFGSGNAFGLIASALQSVAEHDGKIGGAT